MAQVLVRNLEDSVVETLKIKAELKGHSLEQELRQLLTAAAGLTSAEKVAVSDYFRSRTLKPYTTDSVVTLREIRDAE